MFKNCMLTVKAILIASACFSQHRTHVGAEVALTHDVYQIIDNGARIKSFGSSSGLFGFTIRQELNNFFFIETGATRKY